jgi:hypothetical protein
MVGWEWCCRVEFQCGIDHVEVVVSQVRQVQYLGGVGIEGAASRVEVVEAFACDPGLCRRSRRSWSRVSTTSAWPQGGLPAQSGYEREWVRDMDN